MLCVCPSPSAELTGSPLDLILGQRESLMMCRELAATCEVVSFNVGHISLCVGGGSVYVVCLRVWVGE